MEKPPGMGTQEPVTSMLGSLASPQAPAFLAALVYSSQIKLNTVFICFYQLYVSYITCISSPASRQNVPFAKISLQMWDYSSHDTFCLLQLLNL